MLKACSIGMKCCLHRIVHGLKRCSHLLLGHLHTAFLAITSCTGKQVPFARLYRVSISIQHMCSLPQASRRGLLGGVLAPRGGMPEI